ncbi:MAG: rod shape-determining protein MreC [Chloroflexi bacterium]|nr:rod shape-determining protein MreC [Chloroflexota bacterium]
MRVLWWFATLTVVSVATIILSEENAFDSLKNVALTVSAPAGSAARDAASPLGDIYDGIADRGHLVRENERLREEVEALQAQLADQQDVLLRIAALEDALEVKSTRPEDQLLVASVFFRDPSGLKRSIAIDRGLGDGVREGMVVLSREGSLIGTVSDAFQDFAWIRLISDPDSAVNAQVNTTPSANTNVLTPETPAPGDEPNPSATPTPSGAPAPVPVQGIAKGDLRNELVLELLPPEAPIETGSLVVTSGLGGNYPPAILIGSVTAVELRPQAPFKKAFVEPAASLGGLDTVLVLISFEPARLSPP